MTISYAFQSQEAAERILGANDRNLSYIELLLGIELSLKGNIVQSTDTCSSLVPLFKRLEREAERKGSLSEAEILMAYEDVRNDFEGDIEPISILGKSVWPKSAKQREYMSSLRNDEVIFASGPAGTGKTFIAVAYALAEVISGKKKKIVLTRPVVEAGESLGFLPGDLMAKLSPYLRPLYDAMEVFLPLTQIRRMEDSGEIEISPLAYMRGRSIRDSIVILDEAQNSSRSQMKMFLTRLGEGSKAIITGDPSQIDLPDRFSSGLIEAVEKLSGIKGLSIVEFSSRDTQRSRIVRDIVKAYEKEDDDEKPEH